MPVLPVSRTSIARRSGSQFQYPRTADQPLVQDVQPGYPLDLRPDPLDFRQGLGKQARPVDRGVAARGVEARR